MTKEQLMLPFAPTSQHQHIQVQMSLRQSNEVDSSQHLQNLEA